MRAVYIQPNNSTSGDTSATLQVVATTYCDPTVLWRLRRADVAEAKAVVVPHWRHAIVVQYLNDTVVNCEQFPALHDAVTRAATVRHALRHRLRPSLASAAASAVVP